MTVTKKVLAKNLNQNLRLSNKDSLFLVKTFFKKIANVKNGTLNISNFGSFSYKKSPKRIGRNPKTLKEFRINARQKLSFNPSSVIKKDLN